MNTNLLSTLKAVLVARGFDNYDDAYLQYEIDRAIGEINRCRRFTPDKQRLYDDKYEYLIIPMIVSYVILGTFWKVCCMSTRSVNIWPSLPKVPILTTGTLISIILSMYATWPRIHHTGEVSMIIRSSTRTSMPHGSA